MRMIEEKFKYLERRNEGALIGYITYGDPTLEHTTKIADALIEGGIDMLELGIPFSDPIADGQVIQRASFRSLNSGAKPKKTLEAAGEIYAKHKIPIIILTYYNIIYRMKAEKFFNMSSNNGVSGVIVPDLPVEESSDYKAAADKYDIDTIFLAAPSTSNERLRRIMEYSSGFLYLVSVFGVTGIRENLQDRSVSFIKRASSITGGRIPLAVGFGISKPTHVKNVIANGASGAIVGSRFVKIIEENLGNEEEMMAKLRSYSQKLKKATIK